ncbi:MULTISPECIES: DUF4362 domain-containing protein [Bacillaceae]|uniref:DUF4362 domain-containing protein n=1 Tax=Evansella alkalicola TaxID=745819 RepID=A0ABS6JP81_9BACI|nr:MULTISPECIES: DUF4362 domain-containing protein [Bacillaceae]MBU9720371.1 DUF4362 domain-containing protein [Bacillus alkalicola]
MNSFIKYFSVTLLFLVLIGCDSQSGFEGTGYTREDAIKNGDVVPYDNGISNLDVFESFIDNMNVGIKDNMRITEFTLEAGAIFHDLSYDGRQIIYKYDNRGDGYAGTPGLQVSYCSDFIVNGSEYRSEYSLTGCSNSSGDMFEFITTQYTNKDNVDFNILNQEELSDGSVLLTAEVKNNSNFSLEINEINLLLFSEEGLREEERPLPVRILDGMFDSIPANDSVLFEVTVPSFYALRVPLSIEFSSAKVTDGAIEDFHITSIVEMINQVD